jgi:putative transposase
MVGKFKNKNSMASNRFKSLEYDGNGFHFVTICTEDRKNLFCDIEIDNSRILNLRSTPDLKLTEMGQIAEKYWYEIPEYFPCVKLEAFVVMPYYVHGIFVIDNTDDFMAKKSSDSKRNGINNSDTTPHAVQTHDSGVSACGIINHYKRNVTNQSRKINTDFGWQSGFYFHLIRDAESFEKFRNYINNNRKKWIDDKFCR